MPFPAEETEFAQPVIKPLIVGEPQKIKWITTNPDSVSPPEVTPFDISKMPSKPFDMGSFKPFDEPVKEIKFNWNSLPDTAFDIDKLEEKPLVIKTSLMMKPQRIATQLPIAKEGSISGQLIFGTAQGLPSDKIDDIMQDRDGRIWIICDGKLYCYNGDYLEFYPLQDNLLLLRINEDSSGRLWLSTGPGGGPYVIDLKTGVLWLIKNIDDLKFKVVEDHNGLYWVAVSSGCFIIDWNKKTMRSFLRHPELSGMPDVTNILEDHENRMWIAAIDGLHIISMGSKKMQSITTKQGLVSDKHFVLSEDKQGRIWVCSSDTITRDGITVIDPAAGTIKRIAKAQGMKRLGFHVVQDDQENIYIAADSVIYVIDKELLRIKTIVDNGTYAENFTTNMILDKSGRIWKGTKTEGIVILDIKGLMAKHLDRSNGLSNEGVWGMVRDNKKKIWLGGLGNVFSSYGGWMNVIDSTGTKISDITKTIPSHFYSISTLRSDDEGRIWAGVSDFGIEIFDEDKHIMTHIGSKQGLRDISPLCSIKDSQGITWVGCESGVAVIDKQLQHISYLGDYMNLNESRIYCIIEDRAKRIWMVANTNGVFMVDSSRNYIYHFGTKQGLISNDIDDITEAADGWLWVGTEKGISPINYDKKEVYSITKAEGLTSVSGYTVESAGGKMYVGTNGGLSVFTPAEKSGEEKDAVKLKVRSYDKYQGLTYLDFNSNVSLVKDDQIWFGTGWKELTVINQQKEDSLALPAYITEMDILDKPMDFSDRRSIESGIGKGDTLWTDNVNLFYLKDHFPEDTGYLQKNNIKWDSTAGPYNLPVHLQIPYPQNFVSFHFTSTDFNSRDKIRYRYILEGADNSWSAITEKTFTENYRDLAPGKYTFKVCSRAFNGAWSKPAVLSFTILSPWWRTWWAYLLYMLVFGLFVQSIVRYRSRWLKKENKRLEQMVTQRTDELSKSLDELKATQAQLIQSEKMASLGELTAGIAHEIQNPLNFVNNFSEVNKELIDELKEELVAGNKDEAIAIANDIKDNEEKINHHGKRADSIVKGMLQHSRSSSNSTKEPTDINLLADEYLRLSYHGLRAKDKSFNATLNTDFDKTIGKINIIPQDIGRVLLNFYNNAFYATNEKFKNKTEKFEPVVTVTTKRLNSPLGTGSIVISVKDNGNGIPQKIVDKIFQPFFTTKPTGQGTGLGLSLSYDIIKAHGGEIKVESKEGEGSEFTIILPGR